MSGIDFHSHFFSASFFRALAEKSPLPGTVETRLAQVAKVAGLDLPADDDAHLARWIAELDRHAVEHLCTFASAPEEIPSVCAAAERSRGRLSAFAVVDPRAEGAAGKIRALLEAGKIRGALVFPALHHFDVGGAEARPLLQALSDHRAVLFVHCGMLVVKLRDLLGLPRTQDLAWANPLSVIPAANAFPALRFVIPHFGAGFLRETLMAGTQSENILVDTSSSNSWMSTQVPKLDLGAVFQAALAVFGPDRILFGTDSGTFPAGWRADRMKEQRAALVTLKVSPGDREKIFGGNARAILGLR
ncbi:MAG: amidohydrolase family protein [Planctomycetota bacterium]